MTNTNTKNITSTVTQIKKLEQAGCDIIRMAVNDMEDAAALREIKNKLIFLLFQTYNSTISLLLQRQKMKVMQLD